MEVTLLTLSHAREDLTNFDHNKFVSWDLARSRAEDQHFELISHFKSGTLKVRIKDYSGN